MRFASRRLGVRPIGGRWRDEVDARAWSWGVAIADVVVPIVPTAILFDLLNGGDKGWNWPPYS